MDAYDINGVAPEIGSRIALATSISTSGAELSIAVITKFDFKDKVIHAYFSLVNNKHSCKELRKYIILVRGRNNHNFVIV